MIRVLVVDDSRLVREILVEGRYRAEFSRLNDADLRQAFQNAGEPAQAIAAAAAAAMTRHLRARRRAVTCASSESSSSAGGSSSSSAPCCSARWRCRASGCWSPRGSASSRTSRLR